MSIICRTTLTVVTMLLALSSACADDTDRLELRRFLAPKPGQINVYKIDGIGIMQIGGLTESNSNVMVEEIIEFSEISPAATATSDPTRYNIYVLDGQLIRKKSGIEQVLIRGPLRPKSSAWYIEGLVISGGSKEKMRSKCAIEAILSKKILDRDRHVIVVECVGGLNSGRQAVRTTYAEDLGIVRVQEGYSETSSNQMILEEAMALVEIRKGTKIETLGNQ